MLNQINFIVSKTW